MHLFSAERPEASPGRKALLIDGSAIPALTIMPTIGNKVEISAHLRNYDSGESYAYSYHSIEVEMIELEGLFNWYYTDPEATLEHYFNWKPQAMTKKKAAVVVAKPLASAPLLDNSDLL